MRILKKLIPLVLAVCAVIGALTSCDRDYDEDVVLSEAKTLIEKSCILEDIIFGVGFDKRIESTEAYQKALEEDVKRYADKLSALGENFTNFDELVAILPRVYTDGYTRSIMSGVLSGDLNYYTRYYQEKSDIMVLTTYQPQKTDAIEYHYDTLAVSEVVGEKIILSLDVTITKKYEKAVTDSTSGEVKFEVEYKSQRVPIEVTVVEEADGWRLAGPTYAVYSENYQNYKDLENELKNGKS